MRYALFLTIIFSWQCATKPYVVRHTDKNAGSISDPISIYVVIHGWHSGFILSAKTFYALFPECKQHFSDKNYFEIGWGDADFYKTEESSPALALKAIFLPTEPIIHIISYRNDPINYMRSSIIYSIQISFPYRKNFQRYLKRSFAYANEEIVLMGKGLYKDSFFYKAAGTYWLFNTCNTWTAKGLKSAGLNSMPSLNLTSGSILDFFSHE